MVDPTTSDVNIPLHLYEDRLHGRLHTADLLYQVSMHPVKLCQFINVARGFEFDMTHGGAGKGEAGSSPGW